MPHHPLLQRKHWIFDMDGTLTIAQHDFDAIRAELGLPFGQPILEALAQLPIEESAELQLKLEAIELDVAHQSKPAVGVEQLLELLISSGSKLGILTRNSNQNIQVTLKAAGLTDYFLEENILSRDCVKPKPSPAGIIDLLGSWAAKPDKAVMVGDHLHDLRAGRMAGTATVYVDPSGVFPFKTKADICIKQLLDLVNT